IIAVILKNGFKALTRIAAGETHDQVIAMLKYSIQKAQNLPRFVDDQFDLIINYGSHFNPQTTLKMIKLSDEGVYLLKGTEVGKQADEYFLCYGDDILYRSSKENLSKFLRKGIHLDDLKSLDEINAAIKKLEIEIKVPVNSLDSAISLEKIESIIKSLKNADNPKFFNPNKNALKKLGIKLPVSKNGLSMDFANTKYLYPIKGNEKNIVKIKMTGSDYYDKKL